MPYDDPDRLRREVAGLLPQGWDSERLVAVFGRIVFLQIVAVDGTCRALGIDVAAGTTFDSISVASPEQKAVVLEFVAPRLLAGLSSFLSDAVPVLDEAVGGLLSLAPDFTIALVFHCLQATRFHPRVVPITGSSDRILATSGDRTLELDQGRMLALLGSDLRRSAASMQHGRLQHASLVAGLDGTVACQGTLCRPDEPFALRFHDAKAGLVYHLVCGGDHHAPIALYLPQANLLLGPSDRQGVLSTISLHLHHWIVIAFCHFGDLASNYFAVPSAGLSCVLNAPPQLHLGHQLWNELSGIDRLLAAPAGIGDIEWLVADGAGPIEMYGPLDVLFPALAGHVTRGYATMKAAMRDAMRRNRTITRLTDRFVSVSASAAILASARNEAARTHEALLEQLRRGQPAILLGLRVENRTHVSLQRFYGRVVLRLLESWPDAIFVLDGHNSSGGGRQFSSYQAEASDQAIAAAEEEILLALQAIFGTGRILSAIGTTLPQNLGLIDACALFVCPWGAGLAKYRWAARKPGYVFTSAFNLRSRADLHIYDDPGTMAAGIPIGWVSPDQVRDRPDAPRLVAHLADPQWSNFELDDDAVLDDIAVFARSVLSRRTPNFGSIVRAPAASVSSA